VTAAAIYDISKEIAAASALKEQLRDVLGDSEDDTRLLADMIEGETGLLETIDAILAQIGNDQSLVEGIELFEAKQASRKDRLKKRSNILRAMLVNALEIIGQRKFERPIATLTLKSTAPKLIVTDEALIPAKYFVPVDPSLNKKAIIDDLKDKQIIPGAELDNGGVTVQIRFG
jgi:hypothetical protein